MHQGQMMRAPRCANMQTARESRSEVARVLRPEPRKWSAGNARKAVAKRCKLDAVFVFLLVLFFLSRGSVFRSLR